MGESQFDYISDSELNDMFGGSDAITLEHFNFLYLKFVDETEGARFYFDTLVKFIESQEQKAVQYLEGVAETIPDKHKGNFWEDNYPYCWKDIFEEILKESFIISLLSVLEVYLDRTCNILHHHKSIKWEEFKGDSQFHKYRKWLTQNVLTVSSLDWDTIYKLWRTRNVIAHNQGQCKKEKDKRLLNQLADKIDGISIRDGWILIDPAFCKSTLLMIRKFGIDLGDIIRGDLTNRGS